MELIVTDPTYASEGDYQEFIGDLRKLASSVSPEFDVRDTDIGRGADWPAVLIAWSPAALFFLGKKIEENLDAWLSLARRFTKLVRSIRERRWGHRIDAVGATLVGIDRIAATEPRDVTAISRTNDQAFVVPPTAWEGRSGLARDPDALYLQTFEVNGAVVYIFGIKSTGAVEIEYRIDPSDWMSFLASKPDGVGRQRAD